MSERTPVRRALVSVYDKSGLEELVLGLHEAGVVLVSTGSTADRIRAAGVPVTPVEVVTGWPEGFDGRVKTLHPAVHAGLLADRTNPDHNWRLGELHIEPFELLVGNLYPFAATVASGAGPADCVEKIDIGGPAMVRAAAKNHGSVAVVVDPSRYGEVLDAVRGGGFTLRQRQRLAAQAFAHTAAYDVAVATWMSSELADTSDGTGFPAFTASTWQRVAGLRYGENPHQAAALYRDSSSAVRGLAHAEQLNGKEMSYNNYVDTDAAWRAAHDHARPCVAIVKHANPCGIAVGDDLAQAYAKALECDPTSAFGGVVAVNGTVTVALAEQIAKVFTEVVAAPEVDPEALEVLRRKKNVRVMRVPAAHGDLVEYRPVSGGLLVQAVDLVDAQVVGPDGGGDDPQRWRLASGNPADPATLADLVFAWRAVRAVKSNAILLARDGASVGIGMGQVNRVDSCKLAVARAGAERARGSVAASDAFFPFADGLEVLLEAGVRAVAQPGGSLRDEEVVSAARAAGVTMYFTGTRHFSH